MTTGSRSRSKRRKHAEMDWSARVLGLAGPRSRAGDLCGCSRGDHDLGRAQTPPRAGDRPDDRRAARGAACSGTSLDAGETGGSHRSRKRSRHERAEDRRDAGHELRHHRRNRREQGVCASGRGARVPGRGLDWKEQHPDPGGRTMVFRTPIGKFKVLSKEKDPVWVPPDWHFIEQAQKNGLEVVRLERGENIGGLYIQGNEVVRDGVPLPAGREIVQGGAVIIPPIGTRQRQFPHVLGTHRLNLGDGYALHGTQQVSQLGRSVSHGCVRLHNNDIATLYEMASVGDQVIIY
ncbi:MAG: L,D-transpeptidase [Thermoanaerobaculia bacterium]